MSNLSVLKNFSGKVKKKKRRKKRPEERHVPLSISLPPDLFQDIEANRGLIERSTYIASKLRPVIPRREQNE